MSNGQCSHIGKIGVIKQKNSQLFHIFSVNINTTLSQSNKQWRTVDFTVKSEEGSDLQEHKNAFVHEHSLPVVFSTFSFHFSPFSKSPELSRWGKSNFPPRQKSSFSLCLLHFELISLSCSGKLQVRLLLKGLHQSQNKTRPPLTPSERQNPDAGALLALVQQRAVQPINVLIGLEGTGTTSTHWWMEACGL